MGGVYSTSTDRRLLPNGSIAPSVCPKCLSEINVCTCDVTQPMLGQPTFADVAHAPVYTVPAISKSSTSSSTSSSTAKPQTQVEQITKMIEFCTSMQNLLNDQPDDDTGFAKLIESGKLLRSANELLVKHASDGIVTEKLQQKHAEEVTKWLLACEEFSVYVCRMASTIRGTEDPSPVNAENK